MTSPKTGESVILTDQQGGKCGDAYAARWISGDRQTTVHGCFMDFGGIIFILFEDGDKARLPRSIFRKLMSL